METIKYKDFLGSVEVSVKAGCLHGKILFINDLVTYEATDINGIKQEFHAAVDDYINTCRELGIEPLKSFSGSFNVRIGSDLHQALAAHAIKTDEKINTIVKRSVQEYLDRENQTPETQDHQHYYSITASTDKVQQPVQFRHENTNVIEFTPRRMAN